MSHGGIFFLCFRLGLPATVAQMLIGFYEYD